MPDRSKNRTFVALSLTILFGVSVFSCNRNEPENTRQMELRSSNPTSSRHISNSQRSTEQTPNVNRQVSENTVIPLSQVDPNPSPPTIPTLSQSDERSDPIAEAASEILDGSQAINWNLDGTLGPEDLTIQLQTDVVNRRGQFIGTAGFNRNVLNGFRGVPKCNLLAFEIAYRAGFIVPLIGRSVGWGFPSTEMLVTDARDYSISGGWASVRRRPRINEINTDRELGSAFFIVARAAAFGRPGHVAVLDWIEEMHVNRMGDIRSISFMGWESNTREGARYQLITFATVEAYASARYDSVYVVELRPAEPGNEVVFLGQGPRSPSSH